MLGTVMLAWTLTFNANWNPTTQHMNFVGQGPENALWIPTQIIIARPVSDNADPNCQIQYTIQNLSDQTNQNVIISGQSGHTWFNQGGFNPLVNYNTPNQTGNYAVTSSQDITFSTYENNSNPDTPPKVCEMDNVRIDVLGYAISGS